MWASGGCLAGLVDQEDVGTLKEAKIVFSSMLVHYHFPYYKESKKKKKIVQCKIYSDITYASDVMLRSLFPLIIILEFLYNYFT